MVQGRKKNYINKLTTKDQNLLKAFRDVGYLHRRHIKEEIQLGDKRLLNFQRDGYVEKCAYLDRKTKEFEHIYRLTDKGKKLVNTQMNLENFYKSTSGRHDLALAEKYFSLTKSEQDSWQTETDLRQSLLERIEALKDRGDTHAYRLEELMGTRDISIPDGAYTVGEGGQITAVEITTSSYGPKELESKEIYVKEMQMEYETIKI